LTINSNDPANPTRTVQLAGYWQKRSEQEQEPGLQTIANLLFGYGTRVSDTAEPTFPNNGSTVVRYGEEVLSAYWQSADPALPVSVRQLDAFHTQLDPNDATHLLSAALGWFAQGSGTVRPLFSHATQQAQSLLPTVLGSTTS